MILLQCDTCLDKLFMSQRFRTVLTKKDQSAENGLDLLIYAVVTTSLCFWYHLNLNKPPKHDYIKYRKSRSDIIPLSSDLSTTHDPFLNEDKEKHHIHPSATRIAKQAPTENVCTHFH